MFGDRIREARLAQQRSLADVAAKAKISPATLSRIENSKQGIDLGLFVVIAGILKVPPRELVGDEGADAVEYDPLVRRIAALQTAERAQLWRDLAECARGRHARRADLRHLGQQVEELIAQTEFLRQELEAIRLCLRHKR